MTLISSLKRALGFDGPDEDIDDDDLADELVDDPDPILDSISAAGEDLIDLSDKPESKPVVSDEELQAISAGIFDSVLKYFNSHQPELVQRCLDIEAQRSLIIANVEKDLRERLAVLAENACRKGESLWAEKQQRMGNELKKLKSEFNAVRQQREEYQSAQLSATRQKRALTDRIRDLENQVTTLEAEREQYQLENKSMASRLLNADTPMIQTNAKQLDALTSENAELKKQLDASAASAAELQSKVEALNAELESAKHPVPSAYPDLSSEIEELEKQMIPLRELKEAAEAKVISLTKELKESDSTIATLQKRLSENAHAAEESARTIEELRSTIEKNLYSHAEAEAELRKEIAALKESGLTSTPSAQLFTAETAEEQQRQAQPKPKRKKKSKRRNEYSAPIFEIPEEEEPSTPVKISAIDELMESTDWFVAPEPVPLKKDPEVEENFGYKEPQKKNETPDDDRQLTLW